MPTKTKRKPKAEVETPALPPQLREVNEKTGELILNLHPGQWKAYNSLARFILVLAGPQSGKTSFGPHWLHQEITNTQKLLRPGEPLGDFLAVTSTYDLFNQKMLPELLTVFEHILKIGRYWTGTKTLELTQNLVPTNAKGVFLGDTQSDPRMYGRIILRSADAKSGLESTTAKGAWCDEIGQKEYTHLTWEAIIRRLSLSQGRLLGTTTVYERNWLQWEVYDRWERGDKNYDVIQFDSTQNPAFSEEEFERARQSMPAWRFDMVYRGQYTTPTGLVYSSFDSRQCVLDRFPIPDHWLWYFGHDFGGNNPAALAYAQDPATGLFYLVHEFVPGGISVVDQVADFKAKTEGRTIVRRQGGSHMEGGWRLAYTQQGWPIAEPQVNQVDVGIERVFSLHQNNQIMVFRDCREYLREKLAYTYETQDGQTSGEKIVNKSRFHLMDAERYIMCGFAPSGSQGNAPHQRFSGHW